MLNLVNTTMKFYTTDSVFKRNSSYKICMSV